MKPSDPGITWIDDKPLGLAERLYIPLFVQGLATTSRHLVSKKTLSTSQNNALLLETHSSIEACTGSTAMRMIV